MSEILFADDDDALRSMVVDVLTNAGFTVRAARSGTEALDEVRRAAPDLAILDYRMGTPDGFEVCRRIKSDPAIAWLPVLILTAERGIEDRLGGFESGADDYLHKPFDPRELVARANALLRQAARGRDRNPTTGLPGGEALYAEVERRRAAGAPFSITYFDLDHFKPFADRFGFAVADAAIREVGTAVAGSAAAADTFVGHVGGDDFVLIGPQSTARAQAERAQRVFAAALLSHLPADVAETGSYWGRDRYGVERYFPITRLSAAVLRVDPARWVSLEHLGERVAEAKAEAKREGASGIVEADLAI
jgi:PleD family two-component response regulator